MTPVVRDLFSIHRFLPPIRCASVTRLRNKSREDTGRKRPGNPNEIIGRRFLSTDKQ